MGHVPGSRFVAILEGNDHTISNLYIRRADWDYVGLFGRVDRGGSIRNLNLDGHWIEGRYRVGAISGYAETATTFSNLSADGSVSGGNNVGGLFGYMYGTVTSSYSKGSVSGTSNNVGGLVGVATRATITRGYSRSRVTGRDRVGGLIGSNGSSSRISTSYATGHVDGRYRVGGLTGYNSSTGRIYHSYATGHVDGRSRVGGLVGYNRGSVNASYARGRVKATDRDSIPGGLIGESRAPSSYQSNYWDRESSGTSRGVGSNSGRTTGVTGRTTDQMKSPRGTYLNFGSWSSSWVLTAGSYPRLRGSGSFISGQ